MRKGLAPKIEYAATGSCSLWVKSLLTGSSLLQLHFEFLIKRCERQKKYSEHSELLNSWKWGRLIMIYSLCARGEGERMSRLIGLVGEAGTGEVRIRRSGAGDLDRGLLHQRSASEWKLLGSNHFCLWHSALVFLHVTGRNLVLEAGQEPLAVGWKGQCGGSFLHFHHWRKHTLTQK